MKKTLTVAFILTAIVFFCFTVKSQQVSNNFYLDNFGGLNTYFDSSKIPDNDAQSAENVLTDHGYLEKRPGSIRTATVNSGFAARYIKEYIDSGGIKYAILHSGTSIYQTSFGGSPTYLSSTTNSTKEIDSVSAFNRHYITDGTTTVFVNVTTTGTISTMPNCTYLDFGDERIYCAAGSQVSVSSFGSDSGWTVPTPLTPDSPNSFTFQKNDGESISCLAGTPWGKFVGKPHSTHILKGYDNNTYYKRVVDPTVGCVDDRSVQMLDGNLIWLGNNAIYSWDGSNPPRNISLDIEPTVLSIRQLNSNQKKWVQTSQTDWDSGVYESTALRQTWTSTTTVGSIEPLSINFTDNDVNLGLGTFVNISSTVGESPLLNLQIATMACQACSFESGTPNGWVANFSVGFVAIDSSPFYGTYAGAMGGTLTAVGCNGNNVNVSMRTLDGNQSCCGVQIAKNTGITTSTILNTVIASTRATLVIRDTNGSGVILGYSPPFQVGPLNSSFTFITSNLTGIMGCSSNESRFIIDTPVPIVYQTSGNFVSRSFDTQFATPTYGALGAAMTEAPSVSTIAFRIQASSDNSTWSALTLVSTGTQKITNGVNARYLRYQANFYTSASTNSPSINTVTAAAVSTGVYLSQVFNVGSAISAWQQGNFTEASIPSGRIAYQIRTASFNFSATATSVPWTAHTNNTTIAASTNAYVQFMASSSIQSPTETVRIDQSVLNWQEGSVKPVASVVKDHRYYLSVTTSVSDTNNDIVLILQKNNKWTTITGPSYYSMGLYNNEIYAGDSSTNSYVWKTMQDGTLNDDGSPIVSRWVTKNFTFSAPSNIKQLTDLWIETDFATATKLNVGYAADRNSVFVSSTVNLFKSTTSVNTRVPVVDGFSLGRYFDFSVTNSEKDNYFRLHSLGGFYNLQPMRLEDNP